MKKNFLRVVAIIALLGGALIGKYVEDNKSGAKKEPAIVTVDTGYLQDEYQEPEANYDENFRFPWENQKEIISKEKPIIKTTQEQKWQGQYAIDTDTYKKNIIKQRSIKDAECTDDLECREYLMIGYIHEYSFPDFGIKIKTSNPVDNEEYFVKNRASVYRYIDSIYDVVYSYINTRYIRRYQLETGAIFNKEYLEKNNSFTGTIIVAETESLEDYPMFNTGLMHFYQEIGNGSYSSGIGMDEAGNQTVIYLHNPKLQPNYYYKLAYRDGCAPSCGLPEKIDIIASK